MEKNVILWILIMMLAMASVIADTPVSDCINITVPGQYNLTGNIAATYSDNPRHCINIDASSVVLDCKGYSISTSPPPMDALIVVGDHNGVTIKNCDLTQTQNDPVLVNSISPYYLYDFDSYGYVDEYMFGANGGSSIRILNFSSPADLALEASYSNLLISGSWLGFDYLGGNVGVITSTCNVTTVDVNNRLSPVVIDEEPIPDYGGPPAACNGAYVSASLDGNELYTVHFKGPVYYSLDRWDISNPASISLTGFLAFVHTSFVAVDLLPHHSTSNNELIMLHHNYNFALVNMSTSTPTLVHSSVISSPTGFVLGIVVDENDLMYVQNNQYLHIYNISPMYSGSDMALVSNTRIYSGTPPAVNEYRKEIYKKDDILYMNYLGYWYSAFDVSDPLYPELIWDNYNASVTNFERGWEPYKFDTRYMIESNSGDSLLRFFDVSNSTIASGISLHGADSINLINNTITGYQQYGIRIYGDSSNTLNYNIIDNTVNLNKDVSWALRVESPDHCPSGFNVTGNIFTSPYSSISGHVDCPGNLFNITPLTGGNYYGNCTDLDSNNICDSGYIESSPTNLMPQQSFPSSYNSTWIDNFPYSIPDCTPDYYCAEFAACLPDNTSACIEVDDNENCGIPYPGNISDYDQACSYSSPSGKGGAPAEEEEPAPLAVIPGGEEEFQLLQKFEEFWLLFQKLIAGEITLENIQALFTGWNLVIIVMVILVVVVLARNVKSKKPRRKKK